MMEAVDRGVVLRSHSALFVNGRRAVHIFNSVSDSSIALIAISVATLPPPIRPGLDPAIRREVRTHSGGGPG